MAQQDEHKKVALASSAFLGEPGMAESQSHSEQGQLQIPEQVSARGVDVPACHQQVPQASSGGVVLRTGIREGTGKKLACGRYACMGWTLSAALEERIFCLKWEAECRQIARPVCATGLWPYKQMGSRSRKAEGTRNVLVLTQHIPS